MQPLTSMAAQSGRVARVSLTDYLFWQGFMFLTTFFKASVSATKSRAHLLPFSAITMYCSLGKLSARRATAEHLLWNCPGNVAGQLEEF